MVCSQGHARIPRIHPASGRSTRIISRQNRPSSATEIFTEATTDLITRNVGSGWSLSEASSPYRPVRFCGRDGNRAAARCHERSLEELLICAGASSALNLCNSPEKFGSLRQMIRSQQHGTQSQWVMSASSERVDALPRNERDVGPDADIRHRRQCDGEVPEPRMALAERV
jgi:hypothetical protein